MPWLTDRRLLAAALLAWIAIALLGLALGPALGHDEAAFAIAARGGPPGGSWLYRSDGTIAIAKLGIALGGAEWQLRLASAVLGTSVVVAVFANCRRMLISGLWKVTVESKSGRTRRIRIQPGRVRRERWVIQ
jgi:hypothetical protein